jgi:hypothetical protein
MVSGTKAVARWLLYAPGAGMRWVSRRLYIELIPESEAPSRRIRLNYLSIIVLTILTLGLAAFSIFASGRYAVTLTMLESARKDLAEARAMVDMVRDKAETLTGSALKFETTLSDLLWVVERKPGKEFSSASGGSALNVAGLRNLLNMPGYEKLGYREIERLDGLAAYLESAVPGLERVSTIISGQKEIMSEIPNIWPIQGGIGHISMYFGQNENPFSSGQWYLHSGIDISTFRQGDPIVATADGKVIATTYDPSLGNCITIQHSHGFLTRYAHLRSFKVAKGQQVSQGQIIGFLGNTGKSTGPHLHYEVHLGTSIIDPLRFLNVRRATGR